MVVIPFQNIMEDVERLKKEAGVAACDFIKDGMKLGLEQVLLCDILLLRLVEKSPKKASTL